MSTNVVRGLARASSEAPRPVDCEGIPEMHTAWLARPSFMPCTAIEGTVNTCGVAFWPPKYEHIVALSYRGRSSNGLVAT